MARTPQARWVKAPTRAPARKLAAALSVSGLDAIIARATSRAPRTHEENRAAAFKAGAYVGKKATREGAARCIDNRSSKASSTLRRPSASWQLLAPRRSVSTVICLRSSSWRLTPTHTEGISGPPSLR